MNFFFIHRIFGGYLQVAYRRGIDALENVSLSGLMAPQGTPGRILAVWFGALFKVVMSLDQLAEIDRARRYPTIHRKLKWDEQRIEPFIRQLHIRAEVVDLHSSSVEVPRLPIADENRDNRRVWRTVFPQGATNE